MEERLTPPSDQLTDDEPAAVFVQTCGVDEAKARDLVEVTRRRWQPDIRGYEYAASAVDEVAAAIETARRRRGT